MSSKTVETRLSQAHYKLMRHPQWCAFSGVAMMGTSKVVDASVCPTAAVDVRGNRFFCRSFMEQQNEKQFMYVVLHEILHFALSHMTVWDKLFKEDPMMTNIAADHVVNNIIEEIEEASNSRITEPPAIAPPLCDKKYRGWSVKQVYDDLCKQHGTKEERGVGANGQGGKVIVGDGPMDVHVLDGEGNEVPMTDEERSALKREIDRALRQGQYLAGKMGGNNSRVLSELSTPKIDWKRELAEFVQATCVGGEEATWKKPYKRLVSYDMYFPSLEDELVGELAFCMDVSGSCWSYGERFFSELISLAKTVKPSKLRIIQWDVGIVSEKVVPYSELDTIATNFEQCGGGGTTVSPVADYIYGMRDTVQAAVILTDGDICGPWGGQNGWGVPTLWALTSGRHLAPEGKTLRLELSDW
jgi:predicted metal-dependent peptidase